MRRTWRSGFAVLAAFVLTSCGGLDTSGRVQLGQSQSGTIDGNNPSDDYWFDVEEEGTYAFLVDATGVFFDLGINVYSDYGRNHLVSSCEDLYGTDVCTVSLTPGRYFLRVGSSISLAGVPGSSIIPATPYSFEVVHLANEGAADAPLAVDTSDATRTVGLDGASYYVYTMASPGGLEVGTDAHPSAPSPSLNVRLYAGADFSTVPITGTCTYAGCRFFGVPSGPIGIRVDDESSNGDLFLLDIVRTLSEGAPTDPIPLTLGANYQDASVDGDSSAYSYYSVTTGSAAGSLRFTATGTTQYASLSVKVFTTADLTMPWGSCSAPAATPGECAIGNLEANTTYIVAIQTGEPEAAYTLTAATGLAEGSKASPVVLNLDAADAGQIDWTSSSFYSFTPSSSSYYTFFDGGTNVETLIRDAAGVAPTCSSSCNVTNCSWSCELNVGNTYSIEVRRSTYSGTDTSYSLTVTNDANGDGTVSDPSTLSMGQLHTSTLRNTVSGPNYGKSYYEFTTDSDGDAVGIYIRADRTFTESDDIPFAAGDCVTVTAYLAVPMIMRCTFKGLSANTTFHFDVAAQSGGDPRDVEIYLLDLDASEACEPGTAAADCHTFSIDPPPGISNATGGQKWNVVSGEFQAGSTSPSCFQVTSPATTMFMALKVRMTSTYQYDSLRVYLDASPSPTYTLDVTASNNVDIRRFHPITGSHSVSICFEGSGTRSAFIDNLAFR